MKILAVATKIAEDFIATDAGQRIMASARKAGATPFGALCCATRAAFPFYDEVEAVAEIAANVRMEETTCRRK